jgi:hypothetical protein
MSSKHPDTSTPGRAEVAFREAFDRLKKQKPQLLPKGTRVTQNNVAREAGVDPSALKKARFPSLIEEIQRWVDEHAEASSPSTNQQLLSQRNRNRGLREQLEAFKLQRDRALGLLADADAKIFELTIENSRLRALAPKSNVIEISPNNPKR